MGKLKVLILTLLLLFSTSCQAEGNESLHQITGEGKKIRVLVPGNERTQGFLASGFRGFSRIKSEIENVDVGYLSDLTFHEDNQNQVLEEALKKLGEDDPDLIIAVGGQNDEPVMAVHKDYPEIQFVVIQGSVTADNVTSYNVRQMDSAYLAGAFAGLSTETGIVGFLTGTTQQSGKEARNSFAEGLKETNPDAKLKEIFTGDMDDEDLNEKAAQDLIAGNADHIFIMLNKGRLGADKALKEHKNVKGIGNVIDWTKESDLYIASAMADPSVAVFQAAQDFLDGKLQTNQIHFFELGYENAVDFVLSEQVSPEMKDKMAEIRNEYEGTLE